MDLPTEIRLMVWEYAIGFQHLRIELRHSRVTHSVCDPVIWQDHRPLTPVLCEGGHGSVRSRVRRQLLHQLHPTATLDQQQFDSISAEADEPLPNTHQEKVRAKGVGNLLQTCKKMCVF
jgi:hypothetical protein